MCISWVRYDGFLCIAQSYFVQDCHALGAWLCLKTCIMQDSDSNALDLLYMPGFRNSSFWLS